MSSTQLRLFTVGRWLSRRIPSWFLRWRPFVVYEILTTDRAEQAESDETALGLSYEWAAPDQAKSWEQLKLLTDAINLASWDGDKYRLAVAYHQGRPIGVAWIAKDVFCEAELGLEFQLANDEAWLFAAHVQRSYRRQGVYRNLLRFVVSELQTTGMRRLLLGISTGNAPSRLAHEREGARPIGSLVAARIFANLSFALNRGQLLRCSKSPIVIGKRRLTFRRKP